LRRLRVFNKRSVWVVVLAVILLSLVFYRFLQPSDVGQNLPENQLGTPRAAIVDHLNISHPNPEFVETSTSILTEAGYDVDYYEGSLVTVDFYGDLALHGHDLIILRVHSGLLHLDNAVTQLVCFFTSEPYSTTKHVSEQLTYQVFKGIPSLEPSPEEEAYFVITPKFVRESMKGRFDNTLVVMMGCDGLVYTKMAEAFVDKGALAYVGWNGAVVADYVDEATAHLLQGLIVEGKTIGEAVLDTREAVGPDPTYHAELVFYPVSSQSQKIRC
jgi:hypothetical protein